MKTEICFFGLNHFSSDFNNFNSINLTLLDDTHSWLLDTGATLSAIELKHLASKNIPFHKERVRINGIGGAVYTEGYLELEHKIYVFDTLPCKTDGILGQDFMNKFKCILNFEQNTLTINHEGSNSL